MATMHRILDDLYEETYSLFAIHSSLDDYAVVYALNQHLKTRFKRLQTDLDMVRGISFPIFEWKDEINDSYWTLISNHSLKEEKGGTYDLFRNEPALTTHYLIPERRDVDYFLKIEGEPNVGYDTLMKAMSGIHKIIAAYAIDADKLKSKKNLIF